MEYTFNEIFKITKDGNISPKKTIVFGGLTFSPQSSFDPKVTFNGVKISEHKDKVFVINKNDKDQLVLQRIIDKPLSTLLSTPIQTLNQGNKNETNTSFVELESKTIIIKGDKLSIKIN